MGQKKFGTVGCTTNINWTELKYTVSRKKRATKLLSISSPNIDTWKIFNNAITKYDIPLHHNCVATLPCEVQIFKNHYNHFIANCPRSVSVTERLKSVNIWQRCGKCLVARSLWFTVYVSASNELAIQFISFALYAP